jgi:hypothetical protein
MQMLAFGRYCCKSILSISARNIDSKSEIATVGPTTFRKALRELGKLGLSFGIVFFNAHQHANAPHALGLLRARRERPRDRAAKQHDELAPFHSITSSARASTLVGSLKPSALAVFN